MELQDVIRHRRMVRRFTSEPVAQASLDRILANAAHGPSAGFVPEAVDKFRTAFGVPEDHEPIGAIAIGHDPETEKRDLRRPAATAR